MRQLLELLVHKAGLRGTSVAARLGNSPLTFVRANMTMRLFRRAELIKSPTKEESHMGRAILATLAIVLGASFGIPHNGVAAGAAATVTAPNGTPQSTAAHSPFPARLVAWVAAPNTNPVPGV